MFKLTSKKYLGGLNPLQGRIYEFFDSTGGGVLGRNSSMGGGGGLGSKSAGIFIY